MRPPLRPLPTLRNYASVTIGMFCIIDRSHNFFTSISRDTISSPPFPGKIDAKCVPAAVELEALLQTMHFALPQHTSLHCRCSLDKDKQNSFYKAD